jgi:hypothetical protein
VILGRPAKPMGDKPVRCEQARESAMAVVIRRVAFTPDKEVCITTHGKRVSLRTHCFDAKCDKMTRLGAGDRVQLEGNVQVTYHVDNQFGRIVAACVIVNLADGSCEVQGSPAAACSEQRPSDKVPCYLCPFQGWGTVMPTAPRP